MVGSFANGLHSRAYSLDSPGSFVNNENDLSVALVARSCVGENVPVATRYSIVSRSRASEVDRASLDDFRLGSSSSVEPDFAINGRYSPYCVDLAGRRAIYVELAGDVSLANAPFIYMKQFEAARSVLALSFAEVAALPSPPSRLRVVMIHAVARSGSTLFSRIFSRIPGCLSLSEPDFFTDLASARASEPDLTQMLAPALTHSLLRADPAQVGETSHLVIKLRASCMPIVSEIARALPGSISLFSYRDAYPATLSAVRAFVAGGRSGERTDQEQLRVEIEYWARGWLENVMRYQELQRAGFDIRALSYEDLLSEPSRVVSSILDHCGLNRAHLPAALEALKNRSQVGTTLDQDAASEWKLEDFVRSELARVFSPIGGGVGIRLPGTLGSDE